MGVQGAQYNPYGTSYGATSTVAQPQAAAPSAYAYGTAGNTGTYATPSYNTQQPTSYAQNLVSPYGQTYASPATSQNYAVTGAGSQTGIYAAPGASGTYGYDANAGYGQAPQMQPQPAADTYGSPAASPLPTASAGGMDQAGFSEMPQQNASADANKKAGIAGVVGAGLGALALWGTQAFMNRGKGDGEVSKITLGQSEAYVAKNEDGTASTKPVHTFTLPPDKNWTDYQITKTIPANGDIPEKTEHMLAIGEDGNLVAAVEKPAPVTS